MFYKLARFVSLLFHPLWVPTFLFAIIFIYIPSLASPINQEVMPRMLLVIFALTGIIPLVTLVFMRLPYFIMIMRLWARQLANGTGSTRTLLGLRPQIETVRRQSVIQSFSMTERSERIVPFFVITAFYIAVCIMMSNRMGWDSFFITALMTITGISLMVAVITLYWKISVHSVAISSMVGFLMAAMLITAETGLLFPLAGCIVIAGGVMSARLYLDVHSPAQVGWGCLVGFVVSFVVTWIYL